MLLLFAICNAINTCTMLSVGVQFIEPETTGLINQAPTNLYVHLFNASYISLLRRMNSYAFLSELFVMGHFCLEIPLTKSQFPDSCLRFWSLVIVWLLVLGIWCLNIIDAWDL